MRRIEADLTEEERDVLMLMLGSGTGFLVANNLLGKKTCLAVVNKLLQSQPDFRPYEETDAADFPFPRYKTVQ